MRLFHGIQSTSFSLPKEPFPLFDRPLKEDVKVIFLLTLYVVFVYGGYYFGNHSPVYDSAVIYSLERMKMMRDYFLSNGEPLQWFYSVGTGSDFIGQETSTCSVILTNLLFLLPFDVLTIHVLSVNLVLIAFGYFLYIFLRSYNISKIACIPAIAVGIYPIGWANNGTEAGAFHSAGFAILPLVLLLIKNFVITEGRKTTYFVSLTISLTLLYLLSGGMLAFMNFKLFFPYFMYLLLLKTIDKKKGGENIKRFITNIASRTLLVATLSFLIVSYHLIPFIYNLLFQGCRESHFSGQNPGLGIFEILNFFSVLPASAWVMFADDYFFRAATLIQHFFQFSGLQNQSARPHLYLGILVLPILIVAFKNKLFNREELFFPVMLVLFWISFTQVGEMLLAPERVIKGFPTYAAPIIPLRVCAGLILGIFLDKGMVSNIPLRLDKLTNFLIKFIQIVLIAIALCFITTAILAEYNREFIQFVIKYVFRFMDIRMDSLRTLFHHRVSLNYYFSGVILFGVLTTIFARLLQIHLFCTGKIFSKKGMLILAFLMLIEGSGVLINSRSFNSEFYHSWLRNHEKSGLANYIYKNASKTDRIGVHYPDLNMNPPFYPIPEYPNDGYWMAVDKDKIVEYLKRNQPYEWSYNGGLGVLYDVPFLFGYGYSIYNYHAGLLPRHFLIFNKELYNGQTAYHLSSTIGFNAFSPLTPYTGVKYVFMVSNQPNVTKGEYNAIERHGYKLLNNYKMDSIYYVRLLKSDFPYAFLSSNPVYVDNEEMAVNIMKNAKNLEHLPLVVDKKDIKAIPSVANVDGKILSMMRKPTEIVVVYEVPSDSFISVSETYNKNWSVSVDGVRSDSLKVNASFLGAYVPKGRHEVKFQYENKFYKIGMKLTIAGLLLTFSIFLFGLIGRNKKLDICAE